MSGWVTGDVGSCSIICCEYADFQDSLKEISPLEVVLRDSVVGGFYCFLLYFALCRCLTSSNLSVLWPTGSLSVL